MRIPTIRAYVSLDRDSFTCKNRRPDDGEFHDMILPAKLEWDAAAGLVVSSIDQILCRICDVDKIRANGEYCETTDVELAFMEDAIEEGIHE